MGRIRKPFEGVRSTLVDAGIFLKRFNPLLLARHLWLYALDRRFRKRDEAFRPIAAHRLPLLPRIPHLGRSFLHNFEHIRMYNLWLRPLQREDSPRLPPLDRLRGDRYCEEQALESHRRLLHWHNVWLFV